MKFNRVFVIVMDSLKFNADCNNCKSNDNINTFLEDISNRMYKEYGEFKIPNLQKLGLANLHGLKGVNALDTPLGTYAKLYTNKIHSHWDMTGVKLNTNSKTKISNDLVRALETGFGKKIITNRRANEDNSLEFFAYRQPRHDEIIVLKSESSVLEIYADEDNMKLETLYNYCETARDILLKGKWEIEKVVAKPYTMIDRINCNLTKNEREFKVENNSLTYLDGLKHYGYDVIAVGEVDDLLKQQGVTSCNPTNSFKTSMEKTIEIATSNFKGVCFTNLSNDKTVVENDQDLLTVGKDIEKFDSKVGNLITVLNHNDLLIITSNHSNESEVIPMISYSKNRGLNCGCNLGEFENKARIGATIAENFGIGEINVVKRRSLLKFM